MLAGLKAAIGTLLKYCFVELCFIQFAPQVERPYQILREILTE